MPRWKFYFVGRKKDAIGIFYPITAEREGDTCNKAALALYDEYDHIHIENAQQVPDEPKEPNEPTAEDLAAITEEDCKAQLYAILTALEQRTWEECKATLMSALVDSHNGDPKPVPDDECVYTWRDEVVTEHLKKNKT